MANKRQLLEQLESQGTARLIVNPGRLPGRKSMISMINETLNDK